MQIAGKRCQRCGTRVVMQNDALGCEACDVVCHRDCLAQPEEKTYRVGARPGPLECPSCHEPFAQEAFEEEAPASRPARTDPNDRCPSCKLPHAEDQHCIRLATLRSRLVAQFIDACVALALLLAGSALVVLHEGFVWLGVVALIAYYLFADGLPGGQSLGKRMEGIAVVDDITGQPCTIFKSALRNVTQIVGWLDWIWIFGERRRRAGDALANTRVVDLRR